jgi:hypothetical protein
MDENLALEATELELAAPPADPGAVAPASGERVRGAQGLAGVLSLAGGRAWVAVSASLAFALVLSQLPFARLKFDDYIQRGALRGGLQYFSSRLDLFRFITGDRAELQSMMDSGRAPWLVDPELRIGFFRPLSSALAVFDERVFDGYAPGYLLHGGLWYVALCALVALWFQRQLPGARGGLAALGFSLAACHQQPVVWYSARNSVVAAVFGMLALLAHESARERHSRRLARASALALALGLCAGEAGLGALAFIVAGELVEVAPWSVRLRRLAPVGAVVALYLVVYAALGYGTHASGAYIDPLHDPGRYLAALPERLVTSIGVLALGVPADLWFFVPAVRPLMLGIGAAALLGCTAWLGLCARRLPASDRRVVVLLLAATFGALLPQMAGPLGPRSYTLASAGAYGLLALGAAQALAVAGPLLQRYSARAAAGLMVMLHLVGGPAAWSFFAQRQVALVDSVAGHQAELGMDQPEVERADYLVLSAPDAIVAMYTPFMRAAADLPPPALWRALSFDTGDHAVTRTAERSFELEVMDGDVLDAAFAELLHDPARRSRVGDVVQTTGLSARVLALSERGQPRRVEFTSRRSLDDPRLHLVAWDGGHMQRVQLAPGERRLLHGQ